MMTDSVDLKIIPLICPECGNKIDGLSNDIIYLCSNCHKGWEFSNGTLLPIKVYKVSHKIEAKNIFYLPFLVFEINNIQISADSEERLSLLKTVPKIDYVFIKAYNSSRNSLYGNAEISFMLKLGKENLKLELADSLYGCARTPETFSSYLSFFLLAAIDRKVDVSGVTLNFNIGDFFIAAMPFYLEGAIVKDALIGNEMLALCIDDFSEIFATTKEIK